MALNTTFILYMLAAIALAATLPALKTRLELSRAKHLSLSGHSRWARRIAALVPYYAFDEAHFFRTDDAPEAIGAQRQAGFMRLSALFAERFAKTRQFTSE